MLNSPGVIGYAMDGPETAGSGKFTFIQPQVMSDGTVVNTKRRSTPDSLRSCVTAMDPVTLQLTLSPTLVADCWPLTDVVYSQVPKDYPVELKDGGYAALALVEWALTSPILTPWSESVILVQTSTITTIPNLPSLNSTIISVLNSVTCDGETLLITLPIQWVVSLTITRTSYALAALGFIATLVAFAFILLHANHPFFRSAAPAFQCVSLVGILLLLAALVLLAQPLPGGYLCAAINWTTQLGFTLFFAPLFLKAYRIYRIFGRKLKVVKMSNAKLMAASAAIVLTDVVYLSIWQAVAPMTSVVHTQMESDQREHSYQQCSYTASDATDDFFIASAVVKCASVVMGTLLAFSTRSVSDQFNESKAIALTIYNVTLAVSLVAPLIVFINAMGNTLMILLVFLLTWICYLTLGLLFVPRLLAYLSYSPNTVNQSHVESSNSSHGFSFLSLTQLNSPPLLTSYITALEKQLTLTRTRLHSLQPKHIASRGAWGSREGGSSLKSISREGAMSPSLKSPVQTVKTLEGEVEKRGSVQMRRVSSYSQHQPTSTSPPLVERGLDGMRSPGAVTTSGVLLVSPKSNNDESPKRVGRVAPADVTSPSQRLRALPPSC